MIQPYTHFSHVEGVESFDHFCLVNVLIPESAIAKRLYARFWLSTVLHLLAR